MASVTAPIRYFLGTNTPDGFNECTPALYDSSDGWHTYILKGGAGTGKSTLLRSVYEKFGDENAEVFCCSADPDSLDAVRLPHQKKLFIDGTAPHVVEPTFWDVSEEVIPLFLSTQKSEIAACMGEVLLLSQKNASLHAQCRKLLKAVQGILADNRQLEKKAMRTEKIEKTATQLASTEWTPLSAVGVQEKRFISAVTPEGVTVLSSTIQALCPRIFAIEDEHGAVADTLLKQLLDRALTNGQRCIVCPCPLFPESSVEHLLLPDVGVAFVTSNRWHKVDYPVFRRLHASRFLKTDVLQENRNLLHFQSKAAQELLQQASRLMAEAKTIHKQLEKLYAAATDWDVVNALTKNLLTSLT